MMKRAPVFIFFFMTAGFLAAQDMPPLPPLPDQGNAPAAPSSTVAAPPTASAPASAAMPPLPGEQPSASTTLSTNSEGSTVLAAPASQAGSPQAAGMPPLPGETTQAPATQEATPASAPATEAAPVTEAVPAQKHAAKPWQVPQYRPNVIFGGWVRAKGGNETSRLAWTSQEILNALLFKKYRLISPAEGKPEEGTYDGQEGRQFRQFTFNVPHSKLAVQVYIRQVGKKVWLRVGPSEAVAPAATSLGQARKIRQVDLTALHLLQKKFGRRMSPHRVVASWEAPYRYSKETADE